MRTFSSRAEVNNLIEDVVNTAKEDPVIEAVYLFGSQSKAKATIRSDVDFAIVSDSPQDVDRMRLNYMAESHSIPCDFVYTTKSALDAKTNELNVNYWIKKEGILLWQK